MKVIVSGQLDSCLLILAVAAGSLFLFALPDRALRNRGGSTAQPDAAEVNDYGRCRPDVLACAGGDRKGGLEVGNADWAKDGGAVCLRPMRRLRRCPWRCSGAKIKIT